MTGGGELRRRLRILLVTIGGSAFRFSPFAFCLLPFAFCLLPVAFSPAAAEAPRRGLTAGELVASAYDVALDADFNRMPEVLATTCGPAPRVACLGLQALSTWWEILLDPQSRSLDSRFLRETDEAIAEAQAWTTREAERAEAWFYLGAALGARGQWRVLREERLAAARDGKRIKAALEHALALDPDMDDASFGIGAYRYYADIAPAYLRWLRWLFLLPGGNRAAGLAQMEEASRSGVLVRAEAQYQLHIVYLWYEQRFMDALAIVRGLHARYPHNPLFHQIEAEILDVYVHDAAASLAASRRSSPKRSAARYTVPSWRGARDAQHRGATRPSGPARSRAGDARPVAGADSGRADRRDQPRPPTSAAWSVH